MAKRKRNRDGGRARSKPEGESTESRGQRALIGALELLDQRRAPYTELLAAIANDTLDRFAPPGEPPPLLVEIGAGSGQLGAWLPADRRRAIVHTDPSGEALERLRAHAPNAQVAIARAAALPFATGAAAAVLGLCVFDAIPATAHADTVAEIARVLAAGGRFVHWLDMATLLEQPFEKLAASGLVPIPNLFGDPANHDWPLDIVLVKQDWLAGLLAFAARDGHPLATEFGGYFAAFLHTRARDDGGPRASGPDTFKALASNGQARAALAELLTSAGRRAFEAGYPAIEPLAFHSGRYLASVLETAFRNDGRFRVDESAIVSRSVWRPAPAGSDARYQSLCVGHQRILKQLPARVLTDAARAEIATRAVASASSSRNEREILVEAGMFVFVATRI